MARKKPQQQAAAGAPAQGAGGGKGAGQAAPPSQPQAPQRLTPWAKQHMQQAARAGNLDQFLGKHQKIASQQQAVTAGGTKAQQKYQQRIQGINTKRGGGADQGADQGQPAAGAPGQGAGGDKGGAQQQAAAQTPPPGAPAQGAGGKGGAQPAQAPPTVQDILNKQYGSNAASTFQQDWYGGNPLTTAMDAAKRATGEALAGVRNRYGQGGMGNSAREALAEGQAIGDVNTQLGAQLAQLGTQQKGSDLDRLASMFATSGSQDLQAKQLGLEANKQLADLGTGVTGIGAQEQGIPNMSELITLMTNLSSGDTYSQGRQRQPRK